MASTKILVKILINSLTREVPYRRMPKKTNIVEIYRQLLSIAY